MKDDTRSAGSLPTDGWRLAAPAMTRNAVIAGVALIALTNAVALGGVAWNRSGEPDSVLKLTQREVTHPFRYRLERESGGLTLELSWRTLTDDPNLVPYYLGNYGSPEWLDEAKLAELGFDVSRPELRDRRGYRRERLLPREALIVLELDGPAWPKAVERARKYAEKEAAAAATAGPLKPGQFDKAKAAAEALKREETSNSRLFAVDAGLDAAALRAKYPDRNRYAIVTGKVRAYGDGSGKKLQGFIAEIHNSRINVPLELVPAIGSVSGSRPRVLAAPEGPGFEVSIAFGKRYEPWLLNVNAK